MEIDRDKLNILGTPDMTAISNIDEIIAYLDTFSDYNQELLEIIDVMIEQLQPLELTNKDELITYLQNKKENMTKNKSDKEILEDLKELKDDFKNIDVVNSSKYNNDCGKDLEYIMFKQPWGEVEVLVAEYGSKLNEYIQKHANDLENLSAKEVFDYLKDHINVQLKFYKPEEIERNPGCLYGANITDEKIIAEELEEVQKYIDKHSIEGEIEQSVDIYGERLFKVKDYVFKFETVNGVRKMNVMRQPKDTIHYEDETTKDSVENETIETVETVEVKDDFDEDINYQEVETQEVTEDDIKKYFDLTEAKELNGYEYEPDELVFMENLAKSILEGFAEGTIDPELQDSAKQVLDDYNANLEWKYEAMNEGSELTEPLTDAQREMVERYHEVEPLMKVNEEVKKLELKPEEKQNVGSVNLIILLELMIIVMYTMGFIYLVKR